MMIPIEGGESNQWCRNEKVELHDSMLKRITSATLKRELATDLKIFSQGELLP